MVPAIKEGGDFCLAETGAILQYISESRNLTEWYPTDHKLRAQTCFWLHWHHENSRRATKGVLHYMLFPKLAIKDPEKQAADKKAFMRSLTMLESYLKNSNQNFLVYNKPTIADLLIISEFNQLTSQAFNLFDFSPYPEIMKWMSSMEKIPHYNEVFQPVIEIAKKLSK